MAKYNNSEEIIDLRATTLKEKEQANIMSNREGYSRGQDFLHGFNLSLLTRQRNVNILNELLKSSGCLLIQIAWQPEVFRACGLPTTQNRNIPCVALKA